jgi:leucyl/phenylalanyl-tRNA--protein transferase
LKKQQTNQQPKTEKWDIKNPHTGRIKKYDIPKIENGDNFPDPLKAETHVVACSTAAYLKALTFLEGIKNGCLPWSGTKGVVWTTQLEPAWLNPLNAKYNKSILRAQNLDFSVNTDTKFYEVLEACASREETWITKKMKNVYKELYEKGYAHSVEVFHHDRLVGGVFFIYYMGVCIAESMFHFMQDASKVALVRLIWQLGRLKCTFIDTRKMTPTTNNHLLRYGFIQGKREEYIDALNDSLIINPNPWKLDDDLKIPFQVSDAKLMYQSITG